MNCKGYLQQSQQRQFQHNYGIKSSPPLFLAHRLGKELPEIQIFFNKKSTPSPSLSYINSNEILNLYSGGKYPRLPYQLNMHGVENVHPSMVGVFNSDPHHCPGMVGFKDVDFVEENFLWKFYLK